MFPNLAGKVTVAVWISSQTTVDLVAEGESKLHSKAVPFETSG